MSTRLILVLGTATLFIVAACSGSSSATITAKVGDVVAFTNNDTTGHTATSDTDPACTTDTIQNGATGALVFNVAGSYPFHCKIHPNMKPTIVVK